MKKLKLVIIFILIILPLNVLANEQEINELYSKIIPSNGKVVLKSIVPKDGIDSESITTVLINEMINSDKYEATAYCEDNKKIASCKMRIYCKKITDDCSETYITSEDHDFTAEFDEPSSETQGIVNNLISNLPHTMVPPENKEEWYRLEDLSILNYYSTVKVEDKWNDASIAIKFSTINNIVKGANFSYVFLPMEGDANLEGLGFYADGFVIIKYMDYVYATSTAALYAKNVIYIPENTDNTREAYITAVQKRLNEYFGNNTNVTVSYGGLISNLDEDLLYDPVDTYNTDGNYYNITIANRSYKFYVVKADDSKLKQPVYIGSNLENDITIQSNDSSIPLDTKVNVEAISNDTIKEIVKTDNYIAFNISLYSKNKETNIAKLDNGEFSIRIPIPTSLKDKKLKVFYIQENNEAPEQFEVVKENGYATFKTNHFSTYALAEENEENQTVTTQPENTVPDENQTETEKPIDNPKTGIQLSIMVGITIITIAWAIAYISQKKKIIKKI
jgi:hypothetical protein